MLIDWFTIVAQLINFLILIFLLHRFLYRPIVKTIQTRQQDIDHRWQEAEEQRKAAQVIAVSYEEKQEELAQKQQEIMAQTQAKAEQEYHNLLQQARQAVDKKQAAWSDAIAQQQEEFIETLQQKVTEQLYEILSHALQDLADVPLEQQIIATFIKRLETLDPQERKNLAQSLEKADNGLIIRSSFHLNAESREKIVNALHQEQIYQDNNLQFVTSSDLICGIELQGRDYKIPWNLQHYVQSLRQHLKNVE